MNIESVRIQVKAVECKRRMEMNLSQKNMFFLSNRIGMVESSFIIHLNIYTFIYLLYIALRKKFCQINKNILLLFRKQIFFVAPTKHFSKSIKFMLLKQNFLLRQQQKFSQINFFSVRIYETSISNYMDKKEDFLHTRKTKFCLLKNNVLLHPQSILQT